MRRNGFPTARRAGQVPLHDGHTLRRISMASHVGLAPRLSAGLDSRAPFGGIPTLEARYFLLAFAAADICLRAAGPRYLYASAYATPARRDAAAAFTAQRERPNSHRVISGCALAQRTGAIAAILDINGHTATPYP